jgi:hypothetical protein
MLSPTNVQASHSYVNTYVEIEELNVIPKFFSGEDILTKTRE